MLTYRDKRKKNECFSGHKNIKPVQREKLQTSWPERNHVNTSIACTFPSPGCSADKTAHSHNKTGFYVGLCGPFARLMEVAGCLVEGQTKLLTVDTGRKCPPSRDNMWTWECTVQFFNGYAWKITMLFDLTFHSLVFENTCCSSYDLVVGEFLHRVFKDLFWNYAAVMQP